MKVKYSDGKSQGPEYNVARDIEWESSPSPTDPDLLPYPANCHCGAVAYTVQLPSLETYEVNKCNCSICTKNGYLLVYPSRTSVVFHRGFDHLRSYFFGKKQKPHKFCPTCGSSILIDFNGTHKSRDVLAMNVRIASASHYPEVLRHIIGSDASGRRAERFPVQVFLREDGIRARIQDSVDSRFWSYWKIYFIGDIEEEKGTVVIKETKQSKAHFSKTNDQFLLSSAPETNSAAVSRSSANEY